MNVLYPLSFVAFAGMVVGCSSGVQVMEPQYQVERSSGAVRQLEAFVEEHPNDPVSRYALADSLYRKYSADHDKGIPDPHDLHLSLIHLTKAIELNASYAEAYSQRGVVRLVLGDNVGSKQDFDRAIELKPQYDRAYFNRASWFEQHRRYADAICDYERYIVLSNDPNWIGTARQRVSDLKVKQRIQSLTNSTELVM